MMSKKDLENLNGPEPSKAGKPQYMEVVQSGMRVMEVRRVLHTEPGKGAQVQIVYTEGDAIIGPAIYHDYDFSAYDLLCVCELAISQGGTVRIMPAIRM